LQGRLSTARRRVRIEAFLIDADNETKFAVHGLTPRQVIRVFDNDHLIVQIERSGGQATSSSAGTTAVPALPYP